MLQLKLRKAAFTWSAELIKTHKTQTVPNVLSNIDLML